MSSLIKRLLEDDSGATAAEYGLIVAAIAGVIITVVVALGGKVSNSFNKIASQL